MRLYIITGESSGDIHASNLINELKKKNDNLIIRGWGGDRLKSVGVDLVRHIKETSFMGFNEVIKNIFRIQKNISFCKKDIINFQPDAVILVDYPGFNLKIAKFAKLSNIQVFYYISPKVWAWNKSRISKIKKYVDHLLVIFPFEVDFYKAHNIKVTYIGNPLLDEISNDKSTLSYITKKPVIALLPGSRRQEIDKILPKMLSIVDNFKEYQFIIGCTNLFSKEYYESFIKDTDVVLVFNETYGLLKQSEVALVASGTATLEVTFFKVPQVVCYKTNWITYFIAKIMLNIKYISLVNIILNKNVIKELIQSSLSKQNLIIELNLALKQKDRILRNYNKIITMLNKKGASRNAAKYIIDSI